MSCRKSTRKVVPCRPGNCEIAFNSLISHIQRTPHFNPLDPFRPDLFDRGLVHSIEPRSRKLQRLVIEQAFDTARPVPRDIRQPDPECAQHPCIGMNEQLSYSEFAGNGTDML